MELNVVTTLRIMPTDPGIDLESIKEDLEEIVKQFGKIHKTEVKPVAFGLNSLEVVVLLNDSKGGMEEIESRVRGLNGVGSVEVIDISRL